MTTQAGSDKVSEAAEILRKRPRDDRGHFMPLDCPNPACGYGRLQFEGNGFWQCDGLADPDDENKELTCCPFSHFDGEPYSPIALAEHSS